MTEQEKRENAIKGLENVLVLPWVDYDNRIVVYGAIQDAIALLKAQEPVKPWIGKDGWYRCGGCNNSLASGERVAHFYGHPWPKYCEECGKAVKWE